MTMTKTTTVLPRVDVPPDETGVIFNNSNQHEAKYRHLRIGRKDWIDMGEPETITVTIEPGDRLND